MTWHPTCFLCTDADNTEVAFYVTWKSGHETFLCAEHFFQHVLADAQHFTNVQLVSTGIAKIQAARGEAA